MFILCRTHHLKCIIFHVTSLNHSSWIIKSTNTKPIKHVSTILGGYHYVTFFLFSVLTNLCIILPFTGELQPPQQEPTTPIHHLCSCIKFRMPSRIPSQRKYSLCCWPKHEHIEGSTDYSFQTQFLQFV
jgi:hypothetical protein